MEPAPTLPAPAPTLPAPAPASPAPRTLSYAPPDPPRRVSWLDLAGHAMFAFGLALIAGALLGKDYSYNGKPSLGDFVHEYYVAMAMTGAFISGVLLSVRLGPFSR